MQQDQFSLGGDLMIRFSLILTCLAVSLLSIGCCGPMGCGPGCGVPMGCSDCDGCASKTIPYGPLDRVRQMKRSLVCGSGCGEAYVGEWVSTPPDACDPCCGDQWVGGATACRPFCWQPGALLGRLNLYGDRFCSGAESSAPCGCGDTCGGCGCGEVIEGGFADEVIGSTGSCGCAACNSSGKVNANMRMAARVVPAKDRMTRSAAHRMDTRANQIRR